MQKKKSWIHRQFKEDSIFFSLCLLCICVACVLLVYLAIPSFRPGYLEGVYVEFTGMLFDIIVFGLIIGFYDRLNKRRTEQERVDIERTMNIARQKEILDDFKRWGDEKEGKFRIAGAIRRINRLGETAIDFSGCRLIYFSFQMNDINDISGATFYPKIIENRQFKLSTIITELREISFQFVNCTGVIFSGGPKWHPFTNLSFSKADLSDAVFDGAHLIYENESERKTELSAGEVIHRQFEGAVLTRTSFKNATFKNCDFHGAKDILSADFSGANGLETCLFDPAILEQIKQKISSSKDE